MMEHLLAEIRTNQEEMKASQEHLKEENKNHPSQGGCQSKGNERRNESWRRTPERRNAGTDGNQQERMDAKIDSTQEKMEAMIDANNGKFEVL
jgi:GTPase involved in cell partitioning and DNA repair